jgi:hypothetical protein
MGRCWDFSRRTLLQAWVAGGTDRRDAGFDPVSFTVRGFSPTVAFQRRYRMDATILLLGAPLFTRQAAGGGYASVEISADQGATAIALQFAAGSSPARAHGLNRFGILREALVDRGAARATELSFAGLMTRSREESFEQGRKALVASPRGAEGVVARGRTTGSSSGSTVQAWIDTIDLAPDSNWSNLNDTLSEALRREPRTPPRETTPGSATTFLHAMRSVALCRDAFVRRQFMHAGKLYWLETRRHSEQSSELAGTIHDFNGARCAEFRTAYAAGDESGIPIRIEYRPRSFLRLTFEAELEATQPTIHSLFHETVFPEESA